MNPTPSPRVRLTRGGLAASALLCAAALVTPAAGAVAASLSAPPGSSAPSAGSALAGGSLVFLRDHDVWVARSDGSGARPVTRDGTADDPYRAPSQAADGTIAASNGFEIVRLSPDGVVLNRMDPPPLRNAGGNAVDGPPQDVAISPDGRHVAYTFVSYECTSTCTVRTLTAVTRADRLTDAAQYGVSPYDRPSWISNSRLLQGGGSGTNVHLQDVGGAPRFWFDDESIGTGDEAFADPALSSDGRRVAVLRGFGSDQHVAWFTVGGDPRRDPAPATPTGGCATTTSPDLHSPTFSVGGALAFEHEGDLWGTTDPADCSHEVVKLADDVRSPAFSTWTYREAVPVNTRRPRVLGTARPGATLRAETGAWTPRPRSYRYQWLRDGRPIARATTRTYRVRASDARHRLGVRVTAVGAGGTRVATSSSVTVRA